MGVTYKLTEEMVDYIINQKKNDPKLSCRRLVTIIFEKFQIPVSKSSVNAILKDAHLSDPVGRKSSGKKPPVFKIPQESKAHIFPASLETIPRESKKESPPVPSVSLLPPAEPLTSQVVVKRLKKEKPKESDESLGHKPQDPGPLYDGMGAFILKAAQWELSPESILGNSLSKHMAGRLPVDVKKAAEVSVFLEAFNLRSFKDLERYHNKGLWVLSGLQTPVSNNVLYNLSEALGDLKIFYQKLVNDNFHLFLEGNLIKVSLENGAEFFIDSRFQKIGLFNVQSNFFCPLLNITNNLSKQLIHNVQSAVIRSISEDGYSSPVFYDMVGAFENIPGRQITRFAVYNHEEEVSQFSIFPNKRRIFIAGFPLQSPEAARILAQAANFPVQSFVEKERGRPVFFQETEMALEPSLVGGNVSLRIFFLRDSALMPVHGAILTNDLGKAAEDIISAYLRRWPSTMTVQGWPSTMTVQGRPSVDRPSGPAPTFFCAENNGPHSLFPIENSEVAPLSLEKIGSSLLYQLNGYAQRHFFPEHYRRLDFMTIQKRFYSLSGHLRRGSGIFEVSLNLPADYLFRNDLEFAIRRINESDIYTDEGMKFRVALVLT